MSTLYAAPSPTEPVSAARRSQIAWTLKELVRHYNRHVAWQVACRYYSAAKAANLNPDEPKGMPSRVAKARMYDNAHRLISMLELDVEHPSTLPAIGRVISAALEAPLWKDAR